MSDLSGVIRAAEETKTRMEDFFAGPKMRADDAGAVAQIIGAFAVFIDELRMAQEPAK